MYLRICIERSLLSQKSLMQMLQFEPCKLWQASCIPADGRDVPEGGSLMAAGERFFAEGMVEFHGQVIGLVVATSQVRCCGCC